MNKEELVKTSKLVKELDKLKDEKQYLIDTLKDILVSCDSLEKLKWRVRETLKHFKTE